MSTSTRTWLCISIAMAVIGALMLYPIGPAGANVVFVLVKIGMVSGLLLLLSNKVGGFKLWAVCSGLAIVMTAIKWGVVRHATFLFVASMIVDVVMPLIAWKMLKKDGIVGQAKKEQTA